MPKYEIVIEDTRTELRSKVFEASSMEEAQRMAEADPTWQPADGWEEYDGTDANCQIREELCQQRSCACGYEGGPVVLKGSADPSCPACGGDWDEP